MVIGEKTSADYPDEINENNRFYWAPRCGIFDRRRLPQIIQTFHPGIHQSLNPSIPQFFT